jgi:diguanylate cyclase (GGDEF)-like protein
MGLRLMGLRPPRISPVWAWIAALAAAAVALYATQLADLGALLERPRLQWWLLAIIFCLAESFPVHLDFRSETHSLSLSEVGIVLGLFFATPTSLVAALVVGAFVALVAVRRQRPLKVAFNLAEFALSAGIAVVVFRALTELGDPRGPVGWVAAVAGAAAFGLVSVVLVAATITLAAGGAPWRELPTTVGLGLVGSLASASLALAAAVMLEADTRSVWLLVVPAACWALAFRAYGQQRKRHEHVQFLYQTMRATQGAPELQTAVRELLVAARAMVSAEYAAILLLDPSSDQALHSVVSPTKELLMEPLSPTPAAAQMIAAVSGRESTLVLSRGRSRHVVDAYLLELELEDAIVMSLRREQTVFGVLVVGNRLGDVSTFNAEDRTLLETFAGHASVLLENDRVKEQLRYQAFHDALTGLPNRALFVDRARGSLVERGNRTIVLFLDLDDFKSVNDTLGHIAGDELLVAVAERVRACLRPGDTAARLGGDEFGVLLEGAFDGDAEEVAGRLVDAMRAPFSLHGRDVHVHASIGIASGANGAESADELLTQADVAMYSAKAAGKRQYAFYAPQMHARIRGRHDLAASLELALERNEICAHFQPIVTLSDRRTVAFEALARWEHPTRGLLTPESFLPLAEERGLMPEIGRTMLRAACATTARWQQLPGCDALRVAVNLSPGELLRPEVVDDVAVALAESGIASRSLVLEITESGAMTDRAGAVAALHGLRKLGVGLALDDFGTGHASLSHLRDFPIDILKIAKTFVDRLECGASDVTFVDAILRLAATLELTVVAEGIERIGQAELLCRLECGLGQGFHFARPLSSVDAEAHLVETLAQQQRRRIRVA